MKVSALFFGLTAQTVGCRRMDVQLEPGSSAADALAQIVAGNPGLSEHRLLLSVNEEYASGNELLAEGDEIAVFTAVSGG